MEEEEEEQRTSGIPAAAKGLDSGQRCELRSRLESDDGGRRAAAEGSCGPGGHVSSSSPSLLLLPWARGSQLPPPDARGMRETDAGLPPLRDGNVCIWRFFFADAGRDTARDSLSTSVGWIETSTRTAQLNNSSVGLGHQHDQLKRLQNDRSSRIGTLIRVSTTLFRRRCEPPHTAKKQTLSSPPLKGDSTAYFSPNTNH
jgi:hypothetical protein